MNPQASSPLLRKSSASTKSAPINTIPFSCR
jgi:hypothetical protein